nr:MAG TPA_asm: hypothetical protein [Caudoviricetes sp.]
MLLLTSTLASDILCLEYLCCCSVCSISLSDRKRDIYSVLLFCTEYLYNCSVIRIF